MLDTDDSYFRDFITPENNSPSYMILPSCSPEIEMDTSDGTLVYDKDLKDWVYKRDQSDDLQPPTQMPPDGDMSDEEVDMTDFLLMLEDEAITSFL